MTAWSTSRPSTGARAGPGPARGVGEAATQRTTAWLDELTLDGTLSLHDRTRIAAEDGAASLTRVLRSAELAGLDARQILHGAVADRSLDGARNATNVIYSRITDRHRFDPVGQTWAEWRPRVDDPQWQAYLDHLAQAVDDRAAQLGEAAAANAPAWALDAFGSPPAEMTERETWVAEVGSVAAYRELRGHADDADALGPAPTPGHVEAFAAYRAAWRALGRPEIDREEIEMSDGQLRVRVRAAEREENWAPRYVANELAGTHQAADQQRRVAALRTAEAETSDDRDRLPREAHEAEALAEVLDQRAVELQSVDDARASWLAHTAGTRAAGERAQAELALRHAGEEPEPSVTAEEWLAAHRADQAEEDRHREITEEYELDAASSEDSRSDDVVTSRDDSSFRDDSLATDDGPATDDRLPRDDARARDEAVARDDTESRQDGAFREDGARREGEQPRAKAPVREDIPVQDYDASQEHRGLHEDRRARDDAAARADIRPEPDIREQDRSDHRAGDAVRVPSADETAAAIERAHRALAEIEAREAYDAQQEETARYEPAAEHDLTDDDALERA